MMIALLLCIFVFGSIYITWVVLCQQCVHAVVHVHVYRRKTTRRNFLVTLPWQQTRSLSLQAPVKSL